MKRLIIGAVLVVILTIVAFVMNKNQNGSTIRTELSDFAFTDTASVNRIILKDESGETVDLKRIDGQTWSINDDYIARPDAVEILLTTMKRLSVKTPISQTAMQSTLKNMIAHHVIVEIYTDIDEPNKSYYVGGANQSHTGTNMMMRGSSRPFVVHIEGFHGFLTPRFFTNVLEWRSREIFGYKVEDIASLNITYSEKTNHSFQVINNGGGNIEVSTGPNFENPAAFDTLLLNGYLSNFKMIHYESYEETKTEEFIDSVKKSYPLFTIKLNTDKDSRIVHGYRKPIRDGYDLEGNPVKYDQDRLYVWVDSNDLFVGQYAIFDKLTKGVYFFRNPVEN
jgi:hypothetical protein